MTANPLPFGMLFEEEAPGPIQEISFPIYDSSKGISFIDDGRGQRVPYVLETNQIAGTQTATFVATEDTDEDQRLRTETETFTKIMSENTDTD